MKAKEHAKNFLDKLAQIDKNLSEKEINSLGNKFIYQAFIDFSKEAEDLVKARNSNSDECVLSVMKEQSQKWAAFARIVNKDMGSIFVKEDGFSLLLTKMMPALKGKL
jgi:hypothetical protein